MHIFYLHSYHYRDSGHHSFSVFAKARENERRASCMSNMKQIGLGIMQSTQAYGEKYPVAFGYTSWRRVIWSYIKVTK